MILKICDKFFAVSNLPLVGSSVTTLCFFKKLSIYLLCSLTEQKICCPPGRLSKLTASVHLSHPKTDAQGFRFLLLCFAKMRARRQLKFIVLLAGIEPAFLPSEGSILSIERQEVYICFGAKPRRLALLSTGIEPVFPASQAGVLSIKRRERFL